MLLKYSSYKRDFKIHIKTSKYEETMRYEVVRKNEKLFLNIIKIFIICFVSFSIIANIEPFYEGRDSYTHGLAAINFSQGEIERTNSLLEQTSQKEFAGDRWLITDFDTAIPRIPGISISFFGAISFLIGGYYGLFYLTPIFTIILLVVVERISTKTFGNYVGLFTLIIVGSSNLLFRNSLSLQTESMYSLFFILGSFCFINYFRKKNSLYLLLSSCLFVASTATRLQGVVNFPIEIIVFVGFFAYHLIQKKYEINQERKKILQKSEFVKGLILIVIPWIIFFAGYMIFYDYYFGDPLVNNFEISGASSYEASPISLITVEKEDLDNVKQYSKYLLPYQIPAIFDKIDNNFEDILGENWIGVISILILITSLAYVLKIKKHRIEIIFFLSLIFSVVWFYSSITSEGRAASGVPGRYMISVFILSTMIFGVILKEFITNKKNNSNYIKSIKIILISIICVFLIFAIYFSNPMQNLMEEGIYFNDPSVLAQKYPINMEGLNEHSIILLIHADHAIDYGVIPFQPNMLNFNESGILLKQLLNNNHEIYTFKKSTYVEEKNMLKYFESHHDVIFKNYSDSFCKIIIKKSDDMKSDQLCLIK